MRQRAGHIGVAALITVACVILAVHQPGATAASVVPGTKADDIATPITANTLKPPECDVVNVGTILIGSGSFGGGAQGALILGSPAADNIRGRNGDDCILGGAGDDSIRGDGGFDVCIGGPGTDDFHGSCEVVVQ